MKLRLFSRLSDWYQARRRGERRIAPHGVRGRVYEKIDKVKPITPAGGNASVTKKPAVASKIRVIRKDGRIEEL